MIIRVGFDIAFTVPAPTPMLLVLHTHPSEAHRLRKRERLQLDPDIPVLDYIDGFGNRCGRILAPPGALRLSYDNEFEDSGEPEPTAPDARQIPIEALPHETLQFLLASRYCEVDLLSDVAWKLFGSAPYGWARVQTICDWVHNHIEFGYRHARPTMSAFEVYNERKGVCRDYMHLAITFCRCLGIPARYATGYLGDIGIPISPDPMDFSAFFEVFLEGQWHAFDARNNVRRIGRLLMGRGRDAADVALTTSFGATSLDQFIVWTDVIEQ